MEGNYKLIREQFQHAKEQDWKATVYIKKDYEADIEKVFGTISEISDDYVKLYNVGVSIGLPNYFTFEAFYAYFSSMENYVFIDPDNL